MLQVVALLVVSIRADQKDTSSARQDLADNGAQVLVLADREPEAAQEHVAIYGLEYRAAVDDVQRSVGRYLWVVGVFIGFLIVILNTRITSAYSAVAVDSFKWLMSGPAARGAGDLPRGAHPVPSAARSGHHDA